MDLKLAHQVGPVRDGRLEGDAHLEGYLLRGLPSIIAITASISRSVRSSSFFRAAILRS